MNGQNTVGKTKFKLDICKDELQAWSRAKFGPFGVVGRRIKALIKQLETQQKKEHPGNQEHIRTIQEELNHLLEIEDIWWKQRAKRNWYRQGDKNTQYFHAWANQRRRKSHISKIQDLEGAVWSQQEEIGSAFSNYFQ